MDGWLFWGTASIPTAGGEVTKIPVESDTKILKVGWGSGNDVSPDGKTIVFSGCKAATEGTKRLIAAVMPTVDSRNRPLRERACTTRSV